MNNEKKPSENQNYLIEMVQNAFGGSCAGKFLAVAILVFLLIYAGANGCNKSSQAPNNTAPHITNNSKKSTESCNYKFSDFKVGTNFSSPTKDMDMGTWPLARVETFKTDVNLAETFSSGGRLADKYVIVEGDCPGRFCNIINIIDAETGGVVALNMQVYGGIKYQKNSKLVIVNPPGHDGQGYDVGAEFSTDYYVLEDGVTRLLCSKPSPNFKKEFCDNRPFLGVSNQTRERKNFSSSCEMPNQNWGAALPNQATDNNFWSK